MIYQQITPEYYEQVTTLVYKSFVTNTMVPQILGVSNQEVYKYRSQNIKFTDNNAIIALQKKSNKVVGVVFSQDILDFIHSVLNEKITYSEGFQFMRQNILKVIILDYLKNHPNLKRGQVAYDYSGCVDYEYRNQNILGNMLVKLFKFHMKRKFKYSVGITTQQRVIKTMKNFKTLMIFPNKIINYHFKDLAYKGKIINFQSWLIQSQIAPEIQAKL